MHVGWWKGTGLSGQLMLECSVLVGPHPSRGSCWPGRDWALTNSFPSFFPPATATWQKVPLLPELVSINTETK